MIIACIVYLLLIIICLRYMSISYMHRAIWLVANSHYSRECGYVMSALRQCCAATVPRVACGSAAL
jgi:hypothetical protein